MEFIEEVVEDLHAICRCCLSVSENMKNIFQLNIDEHELFSVLSIVAPIVVLQNDGYSQLICDGCVIHVENAYRFRETCSNSDRSIRLIQQNVTLQIPVIIETLPRENADSCELMNVEDPHPAHEDDKIYQYIEEVTCSEELASNSDEGNQFEFESDTVNAEAQEYETYSCPHCTDCFLSTADLVMHIAKGHRKHSQTSIPLSSRYACKICMKNCQTPKKLDSHIINSHLNKKYEMEEGRHQEYLTPISEENEKLAGKNALKRFQCQYCPSRFVSPSKVKRHLSVHRNILDPSQLPKKILKEYKYQCEICDKRVETPSKLNRHMGVHQKRSDINKINLHRPFVCEECPMRFWDSLKLDRHRIIHADITKNSKIDYGPEGHQFICVVCCLEIPNYEKCVEHMKEHREEIAENISVSCKLCGKVYPKLANLIRHAKLHPENATHSCIQCGRKFGMGDDLIDHFLRHEGFKPYLCPNENCNRSFMKHHKLKQHERLTHMDNVPKLHKCTVSGCDKSFSEADCLKRHHLRHLYIKNHSCTLCPAEFTYQSGLKAHMATHLNNRNYHCHLCPSKFNNAQVLKLHIRSHNGDKPYGCSNCNMHFLTPGHLKRHERTHTGEKPYECDYCSRAYSQSNDLLKHLKIHKGNDLYSCKICSASFPKQGELKKHVMEHYQNDQNLNQ